jgi:uncharacterized membrane protein YqgA involved in biofilm formation
MTAMTQWPFWGTLVNTVAVLLGALFGLLIRSLATRRKNVAVGETPPTEPKRDVAGTIQKGLGLCVLLIGISGALAVQNILIMIISIVLGGLVGELCNLDGLLSRFGNFVERRFKGRGEGKLAEGFVSATLLFCVGAMTVTGALEGALLHRHDTYYAKAMIDMVAAVIFASSLGVGVALSSLGVLAVQGTLTLIALLAGSALPMAIVTEMMAVGSLLVLAIGTNLLGVTKIRVMNLVPAMLFPILLCPLFALLPI